MSVRAFFWLGVLLLVLVIAGLACCVGVAVQGAVSRHWGTFCIGLFWAGVNVYNLVRHVPVLYGVWKESRGES